jgi:hypothetical protein
MGGATWRCGSAVFLGNDALLAHEGIDRVPSIVFECTLLLLILAALGIGRRSSPRPRP